MVSQSENRADSGIHRLLSSEGSNPGLARPAWAPSNTSTRASLSLRSRALQAALEHRFLSLPPSHVSKFDSIDSNVASLKDT